jgi:TP901 family phage tail tape measure protein
LALQQFQTSATSTGTAVAAIGFGVLTTAVVVATKEISRFSKAMSEVETLLPNNTAMGRLTDTVHRLSEEFGVDRVEQAKALYQVISAGAANAAEANFILAESNKLAVGGITQIATAADGLTSILNAYGPGATNAATASDAMFVAMRAGKTTIDELSRSVGLVAPLAAEAGTSLEELLAATAALTKGGIRTRLAFTGIRQILASIVKPTTEARTQAELLGLEFNALALQEQGFSQFLETIREKTGGNVAALAQLFGGVEALVPILALTGRQAESFAEIMDQMADKAGTANEAYAIMERDISQVFARLGQATKGVTLDLGKGLLTALIPAAEFLTKVMNNTTIAVAALSDALKVLGVVAGATATVYFAALFIKMSLMYGVMRTLRLLVLKLAASFGLLNASLSPITLAITALGIVFAGLVGYFYSVRKAAQDAEEKLNEFNETLVDLQRHELQLQATALGVLRQSFEQGLEYQKQQLAEAQEVLDQFESVHLKQQSSFLRNQLQKDVDVIEANINFLTEGLEDITDQEEWVLKLLETQAEWRKIQADLITAQADAAKKAAIAERERLTERLEDKVFALSATSYDETLAQYQRLATELEEAFAGVEMPEIIPEMLEDWLAAIESTKVIEELQFRLQQAARIDPGEGAIGVYQQIINEALRLQETSDETQVIWRRLLELINDAKDSIDQIAVDEFFAEAGQLEFQRAMIQLNQDLQEIGGEGFNKAAFELWTEFVQSLKENFEAYGLGPARDAIEEAMAELDIEPHLKLEFDLDQDVGVLKEKLLRGLIDKGEYQRRLQEIEDEYNDFLLNMVEIAEASEFPEIADMFRKMLIVPDDSQKNFRKVALEIERAGRAALQLLEAFGAIDDKTAEIVEGSIQIAANLTGAIAGDLGSIAQVISGAAQVLSNLFGESEGQKRRREAVEDNTKALVDVSRGLTDLTQLQSVAGGDISKTIEAFRYNLEQTYKGFLKSDWKSIEYSLNRFGISIEDAQRIVEAMGGTWEKGRKNFKAIFELLSSVTLAQVFDDASSAVDLLRQRIELFDLDPVESLDALRKQFLDLVELDPATEFALAIADINTDIGRQTFIDLLRDVFEQFPDLKFEDLGQLTPQQFLDFISELKNATDAAQDFADDITGLSNSLKNVPQGFRVALARFESTVADVTTDLLRPPTPPIQPPTGLEPYVPGDGNRRGTTVVIEEGAIQVYGITDPAEAAQIVLEALKDESQLMFGDTSEWARL